MDKDFESFRNSWKELNNLQNVLSLLHWDSEVLLPQEARPERAEQISQLSLEHHKKFTGDDFAAILDKAKEAAHQTTGPQRQEWLRELQVVEKERNRAICLPSDLVEKFSRTTNLAQGVWMQARKDNDFQQFASILAEIVDMSMEMAEHYGYHRNRYDALLEGFEAEMNVEDLNPMFQSLKNSLIPLVNEAKEFPNPFQKAITRRKQVDFNVRLMPILGLPDTLARLDESSHPFSTSLGRKDLRITTRYDENNPLSSIFGVLHEAGHSLYEKGIGMVDFYPTALTSAVSFGIHESQSRLWENQIGHSRQFWNYYYPILLKDYDLYHYDLEFNALYNFINSSSRTKIRVDADQLTYNLHIILRYEIERELISEGLKVEELPERWNAGMKELLDLDIENDREGVLQDIHWSSGAFGYFPTYTLGNIYSAQFFHSFIEQNPGFWTELEKEGKFDTLIEWLHENIHKPGRFYQPDVLVEKVTGERPNPDHLVKYLKIKLREFF